MFRKQKFNVADTSSIFTDLQFQTFTSSIIFLSVQAGKNNEEWSELYLLVIILTNSVDTKDGMRA